MRFLTVIYIMPLSIIYLDPNVWARAVALHDEWLFRLADLGEATVVGSRPVTLNRRRLNEAFAWYAVHGYQKTHYKYYLPDKPDFWEATWYERGGHGWIIKTDQGTVFGTTSAKRPFLTLEIDLSEADRAKSRYPRYAEE